MPSDLSRRRAAGPRSTTSPSTLARRAAAGVLLPVTLLLPAALLGPGASGAPAAGAAAQPTATDRGSASTPDVLVRRARITVRAPGSVETGSRFAVRGKVRVGSGKRLVVVSEKRGKRWKKLGQDRTSRKGAFKVRVRAGAEPRTRKLRVQARAGRRLLATARVRVRVEVPRSPTTVTATWSAAAAAHDTPVSVTGVVTASEIAGRVAVLQAELPSGWRDVTSAPLAADGTYSLTVPTDWLQSTAQRVVVPAGPTTADGVSAASVLTITPTWTPPGAASDWTELSARTPLRYDPCQVIPYRTNLEKAPATAAAMIPDALRRVTLATGLRFQPVGSTTALFDGEGPHAAYPADATLIIGFGTAAQTNAPFDAGSPTIGWGGSSGGVAARSAVLGNVWRIVKGGVVLKADFAWTETAMFEALIHEVGHAVGLGHAAATDQVMYPVSEGNNLLWGAGDLTGLRSAGLQSGCLTPAGRQGDGELDEVVALP